MQYNKSSVNKPGRKITTSSPIDVRRRNESGHENTQVVEQLRQQIDELKGYFTASTGGLSPERVDEEIRAAVKNAINETKAYYEKLLGESKDREDKLRVKLDSLRSESAKTSESERLSAERKLNDGKVELEKKYNRQLSDLSDKLKLAQEKLNERDEEILKLKTDRDNTVRDLLENHSRKLEELARTLSIERLGVDDPDRPRMDDVFVDPLDKSSGEEYETHIELEDVTSKRKEDMGSKVNKLKSLMGTFADKE